MDATHLCAVRRAQSDAEAEPLQVAGVFRTDYTETAAVFAFEQDEAAMDVRRQFFAAARTDDVAASRHIVNAVQRFEQDALFLDEILSVVRVQRFKFRLIEPHELFDAFAPSDIAELEVIRRAVNLFETGVTKPAKRIYEAILRTADDAGRFDGDAAARETKEPRFFMAAAFANNG